MNYSSDTWYFLNPCFLKCQSETMGTWFEGIRLQLCGVALFAFSLKSPYFLAGFSDNIKPYFWKLF